MIALKRRSGSPFACSLVGTMLAVAGLGLSSIVSTVSAQAFRAGSAR